MLYDTSLFELLDQASSSEDDSSEEDDELTDVEKVSLLSGAVVDGKEGQHQKLPRRRSKHAQRMSKAEADAISPSQLASIRGTVFAIFKGFVGTGVLFIPRGIHDAGIFAALPTIVVVGAICVFCMLLLLFAKEELERQGLRAMTYGDIGFAAFGRPGRAFVEVAVFASQVGFCCAYYVFIASSICGAINRAFNNDEETFIKPWHVMLMVTPIVYPLVLVRHLKYFSFTNLIADVIIIGTICYILGFDIQRIATRGIPDIHQKEVSTTDIVLRLLMFIGTVVYAFEGVAMILPIHQAMRDKAALQNVLLSCMACYVVMLLVFGSLTCLAFGDSIQEIVTLNLTGPGYYFVQIGYSVAIVFTFPLMLFPAVRIVERHIFERERRSNRKWAKNLTRLGIVGLCLVISAGASSMVEQLVALIGALACVPLALIFPSIFHYRICRDRMSKAARFRDLAIFSFGMICLIVSTCVTIYNMIVKK